MEGGRDRKKREVGGGHMEKNGRKGRGLDFLLKMDKEFEELKWYRRPE